MASDLPLEGRTALVTGASSGIGRETAKALAGDGANVALTARREDQLTEIASEIESDYGVDTLVSPADITREDAVIETVEATVETFGALDVVVNNAGTGTERRVTVENLDTDQYRTVMGVNTDGMFFTSRAAIPHLREAGGILIFVGSFAGRYPRPASPVYAATKWWTRGFALSLAGQIGNDDIGVTVINPSEVRTEFAKDFRADEELHKERFDPSNVTDPAEVAEAIAFSARQESPTMLGEVDVFRRDRMTTF